MAPAEGRGQVLGARRVCSRWVERAGEKVALQRESFISRNEIVFIAITCSIVSATNTTEFVYTSFITLKLAVSVTSCQDGRQRKLAEGRRLLRCSCALRPRPRLLSCHILICIEEVSGTQKDDEKLCLKKVLFQRSLKNDRPSVKVSPS